VIFFRNRRFCQEKSDIMLYMRSYQTGKRHKTVDD